VGALGRAPSQTRRAPGGARSTRRRTCARACWEREAQGGAAQM